MKVLSVIPARMSSTRFPGKPLKKILKIPMLEHVYRRAKMYFNENDLYIATCDKEIENFAKEKKFNCIMTSKKHLRASDRVEEAMLKIEKNKKIKYDVIVLLQGDEPLINKSMLNKIVNTMINNPSIQIANLMKKIESKEETNNPNEIKVIFDKNLNAINFSRLPIPYNHTKTNIKYYKQVCVIPFRRKFLLKYSSLKPTHYEKAESIDMMRVLENGKKIKMVEIFDKVISVDTPKDLLIAAQLLKKDKYTKKYIKN